MNANQMLATADTENILVEGERAARQLLSYAIKSVLQNLKNFKSNSSVNIAAHND